MSEQECFNHYMERARNAAARHCADGGVYAGAEGAKRLARECGPAMLDFGDYGLRNLGSTYSGICVIAYALKPPIDAKTWLHELRFGMEKAKNDSRRTH